DEQIGAGFARLIRRFQNILNRGVLPHSFEKPGEGITEKSTNTVNQVCFRRDAPTANHKDAICAMPCHFRRQLSKCVLAAMDAAWVGNDPEVLKIIGSCHGSSLNRASRGTGEGLRSRLRGKTVM